MLAAARGVSTVVELIIQLDLGGGNGHPLLQKFPTTVAPRVGETIALEGHKYEVTHVDHLFNLGAGENRHTVWVDVNQIK